MKAQTFNLSLPKEVVAKVDKAAKKEYTSRSDYIRRAVLNQLEVDKAKSKSTAVKQAMELLDDYREDFENLANR
jgi:metal-responsive CopG/Arc/MetJ family transcriptional regulator